jgi:hypothetical protein
MPIFVMITSLNFLLFYAIKYVESMQEGACGPCAMSLVTHLDDGVNSTLVLVAFIFIQVCYWFVV